MENHVFYLLSNISNYIELEKFLNETIDDLMKKCKIKFDNYSSLVEWTEEEFYNIIKNVQEFYKECIIAKKFGIIPDDIAKDVKEALRYCYETRKMDIFQFLAKQYFIKNGNTFIENIDWRIRWVLGSSDIVTLKEPYLQIDLNGIHDNCGKTENTSISFEANLEQVNQLISELTHLKAELSETIS